MSETVSLGSITTAVELLTAAFSKNKALVMAGLVEMQEESKKTEAAFRKMELNPDRISLGADLAEKSLTSLQEKVAQTKEAFVDLNQARIDGAAIGGGASAAKAELQGLTRALNAARKAADKLSATSVTLNVVGASKAITEIDDFTASANAARAAAGKPINQTITTTRRTIGPASSSAGQAGVITAMTPLQRAGRIASSVGKGLFNTAGLITLGAGAAVLDTAQFDTKTQVLANNMRQFSPKDLASTRSLALDIGAKDGLGGLDVFGGYKQIKDFGFNDKETRQILPDVAALAKAQGGNVTDTGQSQGSFMREFGIAAKDSHATSNLLLRAVQTGNINLPQFEEAFKRPGSVTANLGVNPAEALAYFATLTQHGFTPSQAGTQERGLAEAVLKLSDGQKKTIEFLDKHNGTTLKKDFTPDGLQRLQFSGLSAEILRATGGDKRLLGDLFPNKRGEEGLLSVQGKGATDYQANRAILTGVMPADQDVTQRMLAVNKNLIGQLQILFGHIQQQLIPIGRQLTPVFQAMIPVIDGVAKVLTLLLKGFAALPHPVQEVVVAMGALNLLTKGLSFLGITGNLGGLRVAFNIARLGALSLIDALPAIGTALAAAGAAVVPFLPVIAAVGAAVALLAVAWTHDWGHIREVTANIVTGLKRLFVTIGLAAKDMGHEISLDWNEMVSTVSSAVASFKASVGQKWNEIVSGVSSFVGSVKKWFVDLGESIIGVDTPLRHAYDAFVHWLDSIGQYVAGKLKGVADAFASFGKTVSSWFASTGIPSFWGNEWDKAGAQIDASNKKQSASFASATQAAKDHMAALAKLAGGGGGGKGAGYYSGLADQLADGAGKKKKKRAGLTPEQHAENDANVAGAIGKEGKELALMNAHAAALRAAGASEATVREYLKNRTAQIFAESAAQEAKFAASREAQYQREQTADQKQIQRILTHAAKVAQAYQKGRILQAAKTARTADETEADGYKAGIVTKDGYELYLDREMANLDEGSERYAHLAMIKAKLLDTRSILKQLQRETQALTSKSDFDGRRADLEVDYGQKKSAAIVADDGTGKTEALDAVEAWHALAKAKIDEAEADHIAEDAADDLRRKMDTGKLSCAAYRDALIALQKTLPGTSDGFKHIGTQVDEANKQLTEKAKATSDEIGSRFSEMFMKIQDHAKSWKQVMKDTFRDLALELEKTAIKNAVSGLAFKLLKPKTPTAETTDKSNVRTMTVGTLIVGGSPLGTLSGAAAPSGGASPSSGSNLLGQFGVTPNTPIGTGTGVTVGNASGTIGQLFGQKAGSYANIFGQVDGLFGKKASSFPSSQNAIPVIIVGDKTQGKSGGGAMGLPGTPPIAGDTNGGDDGSQSPSTSPLSLAQKFLMHGNNALQAGGIAAAAYGAYNAFHKKGRHGLLAKLGLLAGAAGGFMLGGPMGAEYGAGLGSFVGGQFDAGGWPQPGKISKVHKDELIIPHVPSLVIPASISQKLLSGDDPARSGKSGGSTGGDHFHSHVHTGDIKITQQPGESGQDLAWRIRKELTTATGAPY